MKSDDYAHYYQVKLFKNLANSHRLAVLKLLVERSEPLTVTQMADCLEISQSNLSAHLSRMRSDHIVRAKQDGQNMYYSVKDANVPRILKSLKMRSPI